jgi:hypothetical protein
MYKLFLDDVREPYEADFVIARSFDDALKIIEEKGFPYFISFDHDLGEDIPTGFDFAKWLVEQDMDFNVLPANFSFNVHSANPVGAENIKGYLSSYLVFRNREQ